jgi:hypothetical protein
MTCRCEQAVGRNTHIDNHGQFLEGDLVDFQVSHDPSPGFHRLILIAGLGSRHGVFRPCNHDLDRHLHELARCGLAGPLT